MHKETYQLYCIAESCCAAALEIACSKTLVDSAFTYNNIKIACKIIMSRNYKMQIKSLVQTVYY